MTRAGQMMSEGQRVQFPRPRLARFLIDCLDDAGLAGQGMNGPVPLTASELRSWAKGCEVDLGCFDFQDILDGSRAYVRAYNEFDAVAVNSPWQPDMSEEEEKQLLAAQERAWDIAMGVI